jgi:general secretion pathway protein E
MSEMPRPRLDYGFAKRHGVVLLSSGTIANIGWREDSDPAPLAEVRRVLGRPLSIERLTRQAFDRKLSEVYAAEGLASTTGTEALELSGELDNLVDEMPAAADLLDAQDDAPIIRLINRLIAEAVRIAASDIHVEPFETSLIIRFRVDGVLREVLNVPVRLAALVVSRIKVMARLDIAEKRMPQDGRISLTLGGKTFDVRVSTLPSRGGERVVMRILDKEQAGLGLGELGMSLPMLSAFRAALQEPNGIILVTGPTGSGKTTTLYSGLAVLNDATRNILTVEDPVEYAVAGIGQTQVNPKVGMTFAAGLRAILRQDPDVVMVGEIRDVETAQIAVQASLTGHLVLSTVHTNDAVGAITRLRDMGIEPFLLASTLRLIVAQRLVRKLCVHCRKTEAADAAAARLLGVHEGTQVFRAGGCVECNHSGYVGRVGIYEAVRIDERIRKLIGENAAEDDIARIAFQGAPALTRAARLAALDGVTTVEEALRVSRREAANHGGV